MPDLDVQIRDYFEATTHPVAVDDLVTERSPIAHPEIAPHTSLWRGLLVAATAAVVVLVGFGVPLLLSGAEGLLGKLPAPVGAWSLRGSGEATVGDLDLEFAGGYRFTFDGVVFDGVSGQAFTRGPGPLDLTKSLTLSAWVSYADTLTGVPIAVSQGEVGLAVAGTNWIFDTHNPGIPGFGALIVGPRAVPSDRWIHLVGVSDRDAGVIRFYMDGQLIEEMPANEPPATSGPLHVGGGYGNFWGGAIVDVAVYQSALTSEQVTEIYENTRPNAPPPQWTPDPTTYGDGVLDGTWDYVLRDDEDLEVLTQLRADYGRRFLEARVRLGFDGDKWWQGFVIDGDLWLMNTTPMGEGGFFRVDGSLLTIKASNQIAGSERTNTYGWTLAGDELGLRLVKACSSGAAIGDCYSLDDIDNIGLFSRLIMEHTFTKSGDDSGF